MGGEVSRKGPWGSSPSTSCPSIGTFGDGIDETERISMGGSRSSAVGRWRGEGPFSAVTWVLGPVDPSG